MTHPERREQILQWIRQAVHAGARFEPACRECGLDPRTIQRWRRRDALVDQRTVVVKTPPNKLDEVTRQCILAVANQPDYADLPPSQIVPKLADAGQYVASESSFYRVLKEAEQNCHRQASRPPRHKAPTPVTATAPNRVYSWDITYLPLAIVGLYVYLYLFIDVFSRKIVGWQVYERECPLYSSALLQDIVTREGIAPGTLTVHADNGGPMKGVTMVTTMQRLGVVPSFSRPAVSDDNPFIESFFRTLKYAPTYPKRFTDLAHARRYMAEFVLWYNHQHQHSGIRYVTPAQRHAGDDVALLQQRKAVYERAKAEHPQRWNHRATRNWDPISEVHLNPHKGKTKNTALAEAA